MRAVVYKGEFEVAVEEVDEPTIDAPTDAVVRMTSPCICGSDLHMYEGRTGAEPGIVFGHENMGVVEEVGDGVTTVAPGDRVVMPFNVSCGFCQNCERRRTGFCTNVNEGFAGGAYGYVSMGPWQGGQAEYLKVPFADVNCLQLPKGEEHEDDFAMLADIFPTGWHGTRLSGLEPGESIAIYGAGPVGLMAAHAARIQGASEIYVVDKVKHRLDLAVEHCDAIAVDMSEVDAVDFINDATDGGTDRGVDAVGYQAQKPDGSDEVPAIVLNNVVASTRPTGGIGVVGLYVPEDPGAPTEEAAEGRLLFEVGTFFEKGQSMGTGQANVKTYNRRLRDLIIAGKANPSFVVSRRVPLSDAAEAYRRFDDREEGWTKIILDPSK